MNDAMRAKRDDEYRDIPEHEHAYSVYVRCMSCFTWGIDTPTKFINAGTCGNCGTSHVQKYFPTCCIVEDRRAAAALYEAEIAKLTTERDGAREAIEDRDRLHEDHIKSYKLRTLRLEVRNAELVAAIKVIEDACKVLQPAIAAKAKSV